MNGNLLTDGTRCFAYDDENELISVWKTNGWRNDFVYDGKMRRRIERDFTWNAGSSAWQQTNEIHFIYDGNLVVQERDGNNQPQATYTRGNDLSGRLQGAGGIGGLLARTDRAAVVPWIVTSGGGIPPFGYHSYYHADGNGNVTMLISASQMIMAKYLYDPFGNTLAQCGLLADINKHRFSSKEWNANSGLYYYLYRFYDPNLQRWLTQDPIQEFGGLNLYSFVRNVPTRTVDSFGLKWWQGLPILNLIHCFGSDPGESPLDYGGTAMVGCKECQTDPESAELKCNKAVDAKETQFIGDITGSLAWDGLGDVALGFGGLAYPPLWFGAGANLIATGCEIKAAMNISAAAKAYKNSNCSCSKYSPPTPVPPKI